MALRKSSEDSNGERENNTLTKDLQTKEQRDRVHDVSNKLTWKEGFLENKSMYWKWKTTSTPQVDMKEMKRQLKRELLGDLKPILEAQGIQFLDITGSWAKKSVGADLPLQLGVDDHWRSFR
jgi:hypothetical protein